MAAASLFPQSAPVPRAATPPPRSARVSLRTLKGMAEKLPAAHPLRILLAGEPDELAKEEYALKAPSWFRLLLVKAD